MTHCLAIFHFCQSKIKIHNFMYPYFPSFSVQVPNKSESFFFQFNFILNYPLHNSTLKAEK